MLYRIGRLLQLLGLILLPVAIAGNVAREEDISLKVSLTISAIGVGLFALGWLIQQRARPR
jgi:hypothetical protein